MAEFQTRMMLAVSIASFFFIMASSVFGMPISGTHTVISALVGAGIVSCGASNIAWLEVVDIVLSWIISPILTAAVTLVLLMLCCAATMGGFQFSLKTRLLNLSLLTGFSFALTNFMSITLFQALDNIDPKEYLSLPCSFLLGVLVCRAILLALLMEQRTSCFFVTSVLKF